MITPLDQCRLYAFIDSAYLHGRDPVWIARELCQGGADLIQLRAKDWPAEQIQKAGAQILPVLADHGVHLVINDHLPVAVAIGAPVCHLGQEDFFDSGHRHIAELFSGGGKRPLMGLSTHAPAQAISALEAGADYLAVGPVYPTGTKPTARAVTLEYVRWAAENIKARPWFAIGGIHLQNMAEVVNAGAQRICVVSAILNSPSPKAACRAFKDRLRELTAA